MENLEPRHRNHHRKHASKALAFTIVGWVVATAAACSTNEAPVSCETTNDCATGESCLMCGTTARCVPEGFSCDDSGSGASGPSGTGSSQVGSGGAGPGGGGAGGAAAGTGGSGGAGGATGTGGGGGEGGMATTCMNVRDCGALEACVAGICQPGAKAFFTEEVFPADFGGIAAADAICQKAADDHGIAGTFTAWLSLAGSNVADRLTHHAIPYYRLDGTLIANDWADLTDGSLAAPINVNQHLTSASPTTTEVWTHSTTAGMAAPYSPCGDFTSTTSQPAHVGLNSASDLDWTFIYQQTCNRTLHFYCFE